MSQETADYSDPKLKTLENRDAWLRGLTSLLIVVLGMTVLTLYLSQASESEIGWLSAPGTHIMIAVGLVGLVVVFTLHVLQGKLREMARFRREILGIRVREELLRGHLSEICSLFEPSAIESMHLDLDEILQLIIQRVVTCLDADQGSILLIEEGTGILCARAAVGREADLVRGARIQQGEGVAGWIASNNEALIIDEDMMNKRFPSEAKLGRSIHSSICLPLRIGKKCIGVLCVNRTDSDEDFTATDVRPMMIFSEQIATVIQQIEKSALPESSGEENRDVQTQMLRLERMKKLFMMSINHEVHTRISTILSQIQRLKYGNDSLKMIERSELINSVLEQTTHLKESMTEIMDLSRLEGEDLTLDLYATSINDLVQETVQSYKEQTIRKNLHVALRLEQDIPVIHCDSMKIRRVIANLVSNAIKFSSPGGRIQINTDQRDNEVVFEVTDTGMGIPADEQGQIFELFSRSERAMEQSIQGLGVGLYLVKRFVDLHKGRVWFESTANRGSMFAFTLPTNLEGEILTSSAEESQTAPTHVDPDSGEPTHPKLIRLNPNRAA